jgi:glycosyltransferase involved in cell wall biosynthesis
MTDRRFFVVTPVLNGAQFLPAAIASIDAQTFPGWIHYVVDGGSSDGTVELVQQSVEKEPRRRLIQGRDRGLYDAVFKGFDTMEALGLRDEDICLYLNADDLLAPWAFATMKAAFDMYGKDWITGQPGRWDAEGRLVLVEPIGWYPRWFIARGWFNVDCLGSIQQESTFFTARLLRKAAPGAIANIRDTKLAGDFLLWREFARLSPLRVLPTVIGGFRLHGTNISVSGMGGYVAELRKNRAFLPPKSIARCLRLSYRIISAIIASLKTRYPVTAPEE